VPVLRIYVVEARPMRRLAAIAPALCAALLLLAGGVEVSRDGGTGWPFLVLGSVLIGVAIVLHVQDRDRD